MRRGHGALLSSHQRSMRGLQLRSWRGGGEAGERGWHLRLKQELPSGSQSRIGIRGSLRCWEESGPMIRGKDEDQNMVQGIEKEGKEEMPQLLKIGRLQKRETLRGIKRLVEDAVGEAEMVVEMECE